MKYTFKFLLIIFFCSCETEKQGESFSKKEAHEYNLKFSFEASDPIDRPYKKSTTNDIYGKREYIDSLNYHIIRVYYKKDTNQLELETIGDLMSDTTWHIWYHENGQVKTQSRFTQSQSIPFGTSVTYDISGNLTRKINHEKNHKIKLHDAIEICLKNGLNQPFEIDLSADSLSWEVLIWKTSSFDTISNEGVSVGKGLSINRDSGKIREVKKKREWVI